MQTGTISREETKHRKLKWRAPRTPPTNQGGSQVLLKGK